MAVYNTSDKLNNICDKCGIINNKHIAYNKNKINRLPINATNRNMHPDGFWYYGKHKLVRINIKGIKRAFVKGGLLYKCIICNKDIDNNGNYCTDPNDFKGVNCLNGEILQQSSK